MRRGGAACLAGALGLLAWGVAAPAPAGEIAGRVDGPSGPLAGLSVFAMENSGNVAGSAVTDGAGQYTITGLAADTYFVHASVAFGNPDGLVGETYSGIQCTANCDLRAGTEVAVGAGTTPGIDFRLRVADTIEGTVTAAGSGTPLSVSVEAFDLKGRFMGSVNSSGGDGSYSIQGLPPGPYYLVTFSFGARADQLHPGLPCGNNQCDIYQGTPVSTGATGVNFVLAAGSSIGGTIRGPGGLPLEGARVEVWKGSERFGIVFSTPASGAYTIGGLPVANGFRVFARAPNLVAEVFPDAPCPAGGCAIGLTGTAIDIASAGAAITGKDVQLAAGHSISGTLSPAGFTGVVQVFGSMGLAGQVNAVTNYTVPDLPDGVYQVRASINGRIAELYDDHPCPGACPLGLGDDVTVAGSNVTGIAFALATGRGIRGTVRDGASGDPVPFLPIEVRRVDGVVVATSFTFLDGTYATFEGLPPGNYFVRTRKPPGLGTNEDQTWNGHPCDPGCAPASGDPVAVTATGDTMGIDFALPVEGLAYFSVTPCRILDSRSGPPLTAGVSYPLRLEARCGIPGDAVAVAANVTVTNASGGGHVTIWPANLSTPPLSSVINVKAGSTRSNNAVLTLSRLGLHNVMLRGTLAGGTSFDAIIDVSGYFAQTTTP